MSFRVFAVTVLVILFCSLSQATLAQNEHLPTIGTKVGQLYPDFLLPKLDGTKGRLSDYRGKKVLLIHFASW